MKKIRLVFLSLISCVFLFSCVSTKEYQEAQDAITNLKRRNIGLKNDLKDIEGRLQLMEDANADAASRLKERDSILAINREQIEVQSKTLKGQQERLLELQRIIDDQKTKTEALRQRMSDAMGNFDSEDLSVYKKDGKVYIRMSEKLLFSSGSATVNNEGKKALKTLADALNQNKDINISVEGHTDTVPIKVRFPDNWALSTARAVSIVRILVKDHQVSPERFTASGRSQYEPVADNMKEEGRAKNRRTEIILVPKLDELMKIIGEEENNDELK